MVNFADCPCVFQDVYLKNFLMDLAILAPMLSLMRQNLVWHNMIKTIQGVVIGHGWSRLFVRARTLLWIYGFENNFA